MQTRMTGQTRLLVGLLIALGVAAVTGIGIGAQQGPGTGAGDVAGGAKFRPTESSMQVLEMLEKDLAAAK